MLLAASICMLNLKFVAWTHQNLRNGEEVDSVDMEDEDQDETLQLNENQCHLCRVQLLTKDDLYFRGMMDVAAKMSSSNI